MMKGLKIFAKKLKEDVVKASNFAKRYKFKVNKKAGNPVADVSITVIGNTFFLIIRLFS